MIQKVLKTVEVPQVQYSDGIVDLLVTPQCRVSKIVSSRQDPAANC